MLQSFSAAWERLAKYEFGLQEAAEWRFRKTEKDAAGMVGRTYPRRDP